MRARISICFILCFIMFLCAGCRNIQEQNCNDIDLSVKPMKELSDLLKKGNVDFKINVIFAMGKKKSADAIPILTRLIKSSYFDIKMAAIDSLNKIDDDRALPGIFLALKDENGEIRDFALSALYNKAQGDAPMLPVYAVRLLKHNKWYVRKAAVCALYYSWDSFAVYEIMGALSDKNPDVRAAAARALGNLYAIAASEQLIGLLRDKYPEVRAGAVYALGEIYGKNDGGLRNMVENKLKRRSEIMTLLRDRKNDAHIKKLIISMLNDNEELVRTEAMTAISLIDKKEAMPYLLDALDDKNELIRKVASGILNNITYKNFETDSQKWREWWDANKDKFLNEEE